MGPKLAEVGPFEEGTRMYEISNFSQFELQPDSDFRVVRQMVGCDQIIWNEGHKKEVSMLSFQHIVR